MFKVIREICICIASKDKKGIDVVAKIRQKLLFFNLIFTTLKLWFQVKPGGIPTK